MNNFLFLRELPPLYMILTFFFSNTASYNIFTSGVCSKSVFYIILFHSNVTILHVQLHSMPAFSLSSCRPFPEEWEGKQLYWAADFFVAVPDGWQWHKLAVLGISHKLRLGRLSYIEEASKHTQEPKIGRRRRRMDWSGSEALDLDSRLNINCCECGTSLNQL